MCVNTCPRELVTRVNTCPTLVLAQVFQHLLAEVLTRFNTSLKWLLSQVFQQCINVKPTALVICVPAALVVAASSRWVALIGTPMRRSHGRKAAALPGFTLWFHRSRPLGGKPAISGSVDRPK